MPRRFIQTVFLLLAATTAGYAQQTQILHWPELIPSQGEGSIISVPIGADLLGMPAREDFPGSDEDYDYMMEAYELQRYSQPQGAAIRSELDGRQVKIPGYVTPLGFDEEGAISEFLLVPYLGACIHVPPPPGNQIVYVSDAVGLDFERIFEPIWIIGTLNAKSVATALADVGYTIEGARVEPYE